MYAAGQQSALAVRSMIRINRTCDKGSSVGAARDGDGAGPLSLFEIFSGRFEVIEDVLAPLLNTCLVPGKTNKADSVDTKTMNSCFAQSAPFVAVFSSTADVGHRNHAFETLDEGHERGRKARIYRNVETAIPATIAYQQTFEEFDEISRSGAYPYSKAGAVPSILKPFLATIKIGMRVPSLLLLGVSLDVSLERSRPLHTHRILVLSHSRQH